MTDNVEQTQPEQPAAQPRPAQSDELHLLKNLIREYGPSVGVAVAVVLVAAIGIGIYRSQTRSSREQAAMMLANARSAQELETVAAQHASTPTAPLALLKLARAYFEGGNYDLALAKYDEFKRQHATHPLALAADVGRLHCQEAKGLTQEAMQGFAAFVKEHPKHFLAPQAIFGQARCLEALGKPDEAKAIYEDFIAANPKSGWVPRAEELLEQVKRTMKKSGGGEQAPGISVTNLTVVPGTPVGAP